jgi:hypothetical protein
MLGGKQGVSNVILFHVGTKTSAGLHLGRSMLSASEALQRAEQLRTSIGQSAEVIYIDASTRLEVAEPDVRKIAGLGQQNVDRT